MRLLSGTFKNRTIKTPKGQTTRPTTGKVRESVFNRLQTQIEGTHFLDLFAGSGIMGLEALSRGAASVTFVERDPQAIRCIKDNIKDLELNGATLIPTEVIKAVAQLKKRGAQFDIIFLDPPYDLAIEPILELLPPLLATEGLIILEQAKKTEIEAKGLNKQSERSYGDTTIYFWTL